LAVVAETIDIRDVSKSFLSRRGHRVDALSNVSLHVDGGEFVSLLGPSGCGKTTLLMMIAGLQPVTTGSIFRGDRSVIGPQTDIGIAFQNPVLLEWRSGVDNVLLQIEIRGLNKDKYRSAAMGLLQSVGLAGYENLHPSELSGGMQQRVAICRALVHDPPLVLMDEPFSALDALTRDQLNLDLQRIRQQHHMTTVFVTHSVAEAVFLSDRIAVMSPRPGSIDEIITVDLPRPRTFEMRDSAPFAQYTRRIREIFEARGVLTRA
jgi:NitT/TauT family transport system ATP-binding protein